MEFQVDGGSTILVEVDEIESEAIAPVARPSDKVAVQARQTFEQAMTTIEPMVKSIKKKLDALTDPADEVSVKFSVKLSGQVGAVLTTVGGEATYEISLTWKNQ